MPIEEYIANKMGETAWLDEIGIEDEMAAWSVTFGRANSRVEGMRQVERIVSWAFGTKHDVSAMAKGGQRFADATGPVGRAIRARIGHAKQFARVCVGGNLADQFRRGGQPATFPVLVVLVQIVGDFLDHRIDGLGRRAVEDDGA